MDSTGRSLILSCSRRQKVARISSCFVIDPPRWHSLHAGFGPETSPPRACGSWRGPAATSGASLSAFQVRCEPGGERLLADPDGHLVELPARAKEWPPHPERLIPQRAEK